MKRALGVIAITAFAGCGTLLEAPSTDEEPDGGAAAADASVFLDGSADTTVTTGDGAAPPLPRPPPECPMGSCPKDDDCVDDNCDKTEGDIPSFGMGLTIDTSTALCTETTSTAPGGKRLALPAFPPRSYVVLGFAATSVNATDRAIASISIDAMPTAERVVVVARGGALQLCERNSGGERCAAPFQVTPPVKLLLYGIVTSENPPNAQFVLATDACNADHALVLTQPFAAGNIRGEIGCLEDGSPCVLQFTDNVFSVVAEP